MKFRTALITLVFLICACMSNERLEEKEFIGTAEMLLDGTIVLYLTAESDGTRGHAKFLYPIDHVEYEEILAHIGDLRPGETKSVRPWPNGEDPQ